MGVSRTPDNIRINIGPRRRKPSPFAPRPAPTACPRGFPFYNWDLFLYRAGIQARATISHGWWQADSTLTGWGIQGEFAYHFKALQIDLNLVIQKAKFKRRGWRIRRVWKNWKSLKVASWSSKSKKEVYLSW
jgi:hypothetical protein